MKSKSIIKNTVIYAIKVFSTMLFPLVTFPHISRVLLPEGMGQYNFVVSIISYFSLIAGLGISTYAIREGSKRRNNKDEFEKFAREMYTLNICSAVFAYLLFCICLIIIPKLHEYTELMLILSLTIPLTTVGTEWVFSVYEDYTYITCRSITFQFISLFLMFAFVKDQHDVNIYALITIFSKVGSNILNYRYCSKYFGHKMVFTRNMLKHLSPILVLFASTIASQIYVNSDTTMLGFIKSDYEVGLYAAATKVYNILLSVLTTFITVLTPRMASYFTTEKDSFENEKYKNLLWDSISSYSAVVIPTGVGVYCTAEYAISLLSGEKYMEAVPGLRILSIALIFSALGSFVANEILIISGHEKRILAATVTGAVANFIGNILLIPRIGLVGASITTLLAEIIVFTMQVYWSLEIVRVRESHRDILITIISCFPMLIGSFVLKSIFKEKMVGLILTVFIGIITYIFVMCLLKHRSVYLIRKLIELKMSKERKKERR